jgi:hypothetical protein
MRACSGVNRNGTKARCWRERYWEEERSGVVEKENYEGRDEPFGLLRGVAK